MKLSVYTKRRYEGKQSDASAGRTVIIDSASTFYAQLDSACSAELDIHQRYDFIRHVFSHAVNQAVQHCQIEFVGLFSKVDYCIREYEIPHTVSHLIQMARKEMFPERNRKNEQTDEELTRNFPHNLKATAFLVFHLCGKEEIPPSLKSHFPRADRKSSWGKFDEKVLRVVVERWDENYIWATEEENNETIQVCYGDENRYLTREGNGSWAYLNQVLWEGAQLNLVQVRMSQRGNVYLPELIILEPDFLINITTISTCFESYAESPFVCLVNKIKPRPNTRAIHLGNLAGQFLDDTVHGRDISFADSLKEFVNKNALSMITCPELTNRQGYDKFMEDARLQKRNIDKLIGEELPSSIGGYDRSEVVLEPSFFSEVLGIQGRFDFMYAKDDHVTIIEQKSGKGDFVPFSAGCDPNIPLAKEQHLVQALLYRALYQYEFQRYADDIRLMLLYSRYSKGLLSAPPMPELFLRAIKMRNLLAWCEFLYAKEGLDILTTLTPDKLNQKHLSGTLWDKYVKPELTALLTPIHNASRLEQLYYLRFLRFLENEQLLSKVGNKQKENSGFASIWHDTLDDKKAAGNIYDNLTITSFGPECDDQNGIDTLSLTFSSQQSVDSANFRVGDIVILYPYSEGEVPNACAQMVNRASIVDIKENGMVLRLRNSQTDKAVFSSAENTRWAIEHDMFESMTGSLYGAMHSFLSATKSRRDLILSQREPEIDTSRTIKGDYGNFNDLVTRARQAKDLFLIIGPPGTGKTSFGLVNLLKEELLEEGSNVLLLSYTNRAVDEICSKLVEIKAEQPDFDFLRIGSDLSCAAEYRDFLLSSRCANVEGGNGVFQLIRNTRVFCGTTAAINSNPSLLQLKRFSLAIIDESSQILEPHLIGILGATVPCSDAAAPESSPQESVISRFVLIGDHKQLPAVVQQSPEESLVIEPELNAINLTDCRLSLFERLLLQFKTADGYDPRFVYMLTRQGRMHREIAEFPNVAFYANKLDVVPLRHQLLPNDAPESSNGIRRMLAMHRVSFVASELPRLTPSVKTNNVEADMIAATILQVYEMTRQTFDIDRTIGIIVPYRNQISTVRNAIDRLGIPLLHDITIDTVERYQGSQRDYIIYGFTIHQSYQLNFLTNNVFDEDGMTIDRKLNVAMTRARLNLVLIGNPQLLCQNVTFRQLIDYAKGRGAYVDVAPDEYCSGRF